MLQLKKFHNITNYLKKKYMLKFNHSIKKTPPILYGSDNWEPFNILENNQFNQFISTYNSQIYEQKWDAIYQKYGVENSNIGTTIKHFIDDKIESNTPFSIIRVNDGEGTLLFGEHFKSYDHGILDTYITKRISYIIFGKHSVILDDINIFRDLLKISIDNADILGIPTRLFIRKRLDEFQSSQVDVRAVLGCYSQVCYTHNRIKEITTIEFVMTAWLSRSLLPHYESILHKFKTIAIITGNVGLGIKIQKKFKHSHVIEINIPTQRALLDKEIEPHWPNRYNSVLKELNELPKNTLVLVAAGILGKPYCTATKLSGNSAIDIGHVADIWDGKLTRPGVENDLIKKWAL